jgi:hypothetical protein
MDESFAAIVVRRRRRGQVRRICSRIRSRGFDKRFAKQEALAFPSEVVVGARPGRTIHFVRSKRSGPDLVKTRGLPLLGRRNLELWQSADYRWRELFESADVMSEGALREESEGPVYYGSTSVLLLVESQGGRVPDAAIDDIARALSADPHARLRAVRIACLEAQVRCAAPLGRVRAELFVRPSRRGIRVDVEVEARAEAARGLPGPAKTQPPPPGSVKKRSPTNG